MKYEFDKLVDKLCAPRNIKLNMNDFKEYSYRNDLDIICYDNSIYYHKNIKKKNIDLLMSGNPSCDSIILSHNKIRDSIVFNSLIGENNNINDSKINNSYICNCKLIRSSIIYNSELDNVKLDGPIILKKTKAKNINIDYKLLEKMKLLHYLSNTWYFILENIDFEIDSYKSLEAAILINNLRNV